MTRLALSFALLGGLAPLAAHAEPAPPAPPAPISPAEALAQARLLYAKGDFAHARELLLVAYQGAPDPEILFALGQVEFNLAHYPAAIAFYERFLATSPSAEQAALAQQAIGAARARVVEPPPKPVPPPIEHGTRHHWQLLDTSLTTLGAVTGLVGAGVIYHARTLSKNDSGSLSAYDDRLAHARRLRTAGIALGAAGALVIVGALVHWRMHTETYEIRATATADSAGLSLEHTW